MKKLLLFLFLISLTSYGQIPSGYYDTATGTGYTLKSQLHSIISNGHVDKGYSALYTGYQTTDNDSYYENDGTVLDMYSENPSGNDPYNYNHGSNNCGNYSSESDCYNREHLFPQGIFGSASPMKNDIHHVVPSDGKVNGQRGSYPFGEVTNPTWTSLNGSKRGNNTTDGYSGVVFEPIDEFKGDIARCMLYFATRYETQVDSWSHDMINGTEDQVYEDWFITLLVKWHTNDPVSTREIDRNNAAYAYQGNRNPYIDHPEYVNVIWSAFTTTPDTENPTTPTNLVASNITNTTVDLAWTASTDNIGVTSYEIFVDGVSYTTSTTNAKTVTGLTKNTEYDFTVFAKDAAGNTSTVSNTETATTDNFIDSEAPSAITDLVASNISSSSVDLTWTASTDNVGVASYEVFKDGVFLASIATNSYAAISLSAETTYSFTVYAKDAANNTSLVSNTETATTLEASLITGIYFQGFEGTVNDTWNYTLSTTNCNDNNNDVWDVVSSVGSISTAKTDTYFFGIRDLDGNCGTSDGETISFEAADISGISDVTLSFAINVVGYDVSNGDIITYEIFNDDVSQGVVTVTVGSPYSTTGWEEISVTIPDSVTSVKMDIHVKQNGSSDYAGIDNVKLSGTETVLSNEDLEQKLFSVYPNPSKNNTVTISLSDNEITSIQLFSITGQLIKNIQKPSSRDNKVMIDYIPSGIYLLKVKSDEAVATKKIIVE